MIQGWLRNIGWSIVGIGLGIGLGLVLGWVVWPTQFSEANPTILQEDYRRDYILMIAAAYAVDGNLPLAQERLASLGEDSQDELFALMLSAILQNSNETDIRQLVQLASDLGLESPAMTPYLPTTTNQ